jgi:hypothetical protein
MIGFDVLRSCSDQPVSVTAESAMLYSSTHSGSEEPGVYMISVTTTRACVRCGMSDSNAQSIAFATGCVAAIIGVTSRL